MTAQASDPDAMITETSDAEAPKKGVVDYTALETSLNDLKLLAKTNMEEALEKLLAIEKTHRLAGDAICTKKVCVVVVQVCYAAAQWASLNEHIVLLSKRRSQLKQAVVGMVQEAMTFVDQVPDVEIKVELIKTLSTVTAGKIYVEVERARLVRQLARIKEEQGDIDAAAEAMQEVAVETYGAMAKTEKVQFILEQVRLCLDKKDFVRATILSKKISPRTFMVKGKSEKDEKKGAAPSQTAPEYAPFEGTPSMPELKLAYYALCIRIHMHSNDYLEVSRSYQSVYQDDEVAKDPERWQPVLKKICWFVVLAPHGTEQSSMLHSVASDPKLKDLPQYHALLKLFTTMEVIRWPSVQTTFAQEMVNEQEVFGGESSKRMEDLQQRVVEHNILVIKKYYSRITLPRLSQLLDVDVAKAEKHLSEMVVSKTIKAKLDRPAGIVDFVGKKDASELLNQWAGNIERVLGLVDQSCHKIQKEVMTHKVSIGV